jgi:phenylalanyl-tRNA synthetase alpha subunit
MSEALSALYAVRVGYSLERLAILRYDIDDIRTIDVMHVASACSS